MRLFPGLRMRFLLAPLSIVLLLCVAGCRPAPPQPLPVIAQGDGRVAWRGTVPCADCAGIAVQLVLERHGDDRRYVLVETYLAADGGRRFAGHGRWRLEAQLLHLHGRDGSRRTYALADDGSLQSRDSHGRPLPVQDDATLSPFAP